MTSPAILVVTHDTDIAREVFDCVDGTGCRVRVRESVDDAVADLKKSRGIALMLLDATFASANALSRIRGCEPGLDLPVIVLDSRKKTTEVAGADAVIPHPLHKPTIRAWVHMAERLCAIANTNGVKAPTRDERSTEPLLRTASLSHAVASPLQNICAAVDLIDLALPPDFEERAQLEAIRHHVKRAAEIVRAASEEARQALKPAGRNG